MTTVSILTILAAVCFVTPFFIWGVIRFLDKHKQKVLYWKKNVLISSFVICFLIGLIFIILAVVL
ncbi:hypothetical protein [Mesoplasma florum]|uniref:hypothetical protein n=1 Tax=Mesoplasma florum TaxID=2151 RepID=UPI000D09158F|nr:hypothetical protein [Mesoplasma florum]AVN61300.1 hypothetical protein CG005_03370 [Mesoplasma florum]